MTVEWEKRAGRGMSGSRGGWKKKNGKEERLSRGEGVGWWWWWGGVGEMFEAPFSSSLPTLLLGDIWRKCK